VTGAPGAHHKDLELARACERGDEAAWDRFIAEYRPILYRSADAIDPSGGAREVADSLYAELYGLKERDGQRKSLFAYFQGRSSLATWLRAILAQRYVDRIRGTRRLEELADDHVARSPSPSVDRSRYAAAMEDALAEVVGALEPRDRLRLGCYYAQEMTLVQIGKLTRESEATVSRQLARTRRGIREAVERHLRDRAGFGDAEIRECFAAVVEDTGELDLGALLGARKNSAADRSKAGGTSR
jgi:RNA polymerase sigma-70 factor (ECF subfamily)